MDRHPTSERSSSEEITWLTGSWTVGPGASGRASARPRRRPPGVEEKETYWFSGAVLVAGGGLHGGDDLAGDAELGEVAKARLAVGAEVADGLVEAHQPLLDEVFGVSPGEEVGGGLQADEAVIAADETVVGVAVALLGQGDQEAILNLGFRVSGYGRFGPRADPFYGPRVYGQPRTCSVAHSSPGAKAMSIPKVSQP